MKKATEERQPTPFETLKRNMENKYPCLVRKHSEETKKQMSTSAKNCTAYTTEQRRNNAAEMRKRITQESIEKMGKSLAGKKRDENTCKKLSLTQKLVVKKLWEDPEYRRKHLEAIRSEETRVKVGKASKEHWQNAKIREKQIKAMRIGQNARPTGAEQKVEILLNYILPGEYKYTGDREEPDFTNCDGQRKLIEVNGCYFHACEKCGYGSITLGRQTADEIREHDKIKIGNYKALSYSTLVIWEHELKAIKWNCEMEIAELSPLIDKILEFNSSYISKEV